MMSEAVASFLSMFKLYHGKKVGRKTEKKKPRGVSRGLNF